MTIHQCIAELRCFRSGVHTIHTLVYDPNTLDLSIVVPGVTTGFEVNALSIQGGGGILCEPDVLGAKVVVADPMQATITADDATVCLDNATVTISATPDGNSVEPMFYQTVYVLTSGPDLVIQDAGPLPVSRSVTQAATSSNNAGVRSEHA